jgi:hypothetical protein
VPARAVDRRRAEDRRSRPVVLAGRCGQVDRVHVQRLRRALVLVLLPGPARLTRPPRPWRCRSWLGRRCRRHPAAVRDRDIAERVLAQAFV